MNKNHIPVLFFLLTASMCLLSQNTNTFVHIHYNYRFLIDSSGFVGPTAIDTMYYPDKKIKAIGTVALDYDSVKSDLKVGLWTEYYSDGKIKSKGNYEMDSYVTCCFLGPCRQFVTYKKGHWKYFHENGKLKASGKYKVKKQHIFTTCKGSYERVFNSRIDNSWHYYDEEGRKKKMTKKLIREIEKMNYE
ncbi:MAG: hypothetical protein R2852_06890 [Bacteroidia bacterium]